MTNHVNPLVTVIMIVQNGELFIREALQSIFVQDYHPFEILVVHGKSQDNTLQILNTYSNIEIIQQNGSGVSDAYNTGIKAAKADYLAFLSFDDIWTPHKLKVQMEYMLGHPKILFTNCHIKYFIESDCGIPKGFRKEWLIGTHPARIMETLLARKSVFEKVGYFNTELTTAEDVDWYCRAANMNIPSFIVPEVFLNKRIHDSNISMNIEKNNKNLLLALRSAVNRKREDINNE